MRYTAAFEQVFFNGLQSPETCSVSLLEEHKINLLLGTTVYLLEWLTWVMLTAFSVGEAGVELEFVGILWAFMLTSNSLGSFETHTYPARCQFHFCMFILEN